MTVSLVPDCLASQLPGSLAEVEAAASAAEQTTVEKAAEAMRPEIELPGAVRWIRRRVTAVRRLLVTLLGLRPDLLRGCAPTLTSFRTRLQRGDVLVGLREIAAPHLQHLAPPVGFRHRAGESRAGEKLLQQSMGPDPPAAMRKGVSDRAT